MTIEEAMSNIEIAGLWPVSEAARKLWRDAMLAVHVEACEVAGRTAHGKGWRRRECGDGWYCGRAKAIQS